MGSVTVRRSYEKRTKTKDEICVCFESKEIRDAVKARGPSLANFREAGMRLQIPDSLQKDFKALMVVTFNLKKTNPELKKNVKFDEEDLGLFMDFQTKKEGSWSRIKPTQANRILQTRKREGNGPENLNDAEIKSLMGDQSD